MVLRVAPCTLLCALTLSLLAGCGADGGGAADRPSVTASLSPKATLPSPTRSAVKPTPTRSAVEPTPTRTAVEPTPTRTAVEPSPTPSAVQPTKTQSSSPRPSPSPSQSPSPTRTEPTRTSEPSQQPTAGSSTVVVVPVPTVAASSASASTAPAPGEAVDAAGEETAPAALWVLLALLVVAVSAGAWLVRWPGSQASWFRSCGRPGLWTGWSAAGRWRCRGWRPRRTG